MKIALDPGHGGEDTGAPGPTGLNESDVVLELAQQVYWDLDDMGHDVVLTRNSDEFVELGDRCDIANNFDADYFVSIHCNSDGPDAVGIETLYKTESGKQLAIPIQEFLVGMTGDRDRGLKHRDDLYVLNGTMMPAVLAEVGFISHPPTEKKLYTSEYKLLIAQAILAGISKFLNGEEPEPEPEPEPLK